MTRKCFKNKNSYLFTQKSMANFSIFLITTLLVTILIGQSSTAITPNPNQSSIIISQNSNQVNSTSSNSSAESCPELLEKEEEKPQRRGRNSESEIEKDEHGATRPKDTTRGNTLKPTIISPKSKVKSNKPTISWCAVEGATSYDIYLAEAAGKELWKTKKLKEDTKLKYPASLQLIYPNDKPSLEEGILYQLTIQAKKDEKKHGSIANETFRLINNN